MAMVCRCVAVSSVVAAGRGLSLRHRHPQPPSRVLLATGTSLQRSLRLSGSVSATSVDAEAPSSASDDGGRASASAPAAPRFQAYLDFKFIRDNVELLETNARRRNSSADISAVAELYDQFLSMKLQTEEIQRARNENSMAMKQKLEAEQRAAIIQAGKKLKEELEVLEVKLGQIEGKLQLEGQKIPNLTHPDVPVGDNEGLATLINEVW